VYMDSGVVQGYRCAGMVQEFVGTGVVKGYKGAVEILG